MLQPTYPGSPRHSTSTHPDIEFGREEGSIGGQEGIGPTNAQSRSNTCPLDLPMQLCEGVVVNVAVGGDGDVERLVEVVALIYQQPGSSPREKQTNIRPTRGASGVEERFLQITPCPPTQIPLREVYFQPGKSPISTIFRCYCGGGELRRLNAV